MILRTFRILCYFSDLLILTFLLFLQAWPANPRSALAEEVGAKLTKNARVVPKTKTKQRWLQTAELAVVQPLAAESRQSHPVQEPVYDSKL